MSRIFTVSVASDYPHYVTRVEKEGRAVAEFHEVTNRRTMLERACRNPLQVASRPKGVAAHR